jgi:hypothetical protein
MDSNSSTLSSQHPQTLRFTCINPDLNVHRTTIEGKLGTDVHRKLVRTNKYLFYDSSHHSVSHKKSMAKTLLQRTEFLPPNSQVMMKANVY